MWPRVGSCGLVWARVGSCGLMCARIGSCMLCGLVRACVGPCKLVYARVTYVTIARSSSSLSYGVHATVQKLKMEKLCINAF